MSLINIRTAVFGFFLFVVSTNSSANIVQNGGFEVGAFINTAANYMVLTPGDTALTDWSIANEGIAWGLNPTDGNSAASGAGFVDLSGLGAAFPNSQLQQILITSVGTQYLFSYDRIGASDVVLDGNLLSLTAGATNNGWTTYTSMFTATSALSLLSLNNLGTSNQIVFIDNVSLAEIDVSAIPIPGAIWLFGTGILGLIGLRKRKV